MAGAARETKGKVMGAIVRRAKGRKWKGKPGHRCRETTMLYVSIAMMVYWKRKRLTSVKRPKLRKAAWSADHSQCGVKLTSLSFGNGSFAAGVTSKVKHKKCHSTHKNTY
jgi:hypothetical protein